MGPPSSIERDLLYFTPNDVLVPRVDRQCIIRFCEALAAENVNVEVVSLNVTVEFDEPTRTHSPWEVYGIAPAFRITVLPSPARQTTDRQALLALWRALVYSIYALHRVRKLASERRPVFFFKNYLYGVPFVFLRRLSSRHPILLFEIHDLPESVLDRWVLRHVDGVVPISERLREELTSRFRLDSARMLVAHQGVSLDGPRQHGLTQVEARRSLGLTASRPLVVYTGKVTADSTEVGYLLELAAALPEARVVIVGGREDHVEKLRARVANEAIGNVQLVGFIAPADVYRYQYAADVLVSYYPSTLSRRDFISPGKIFEYMASRRPIVAADYASTRELLSDDSAVLIEPDRPDLLAGAIRALLADPERAQVIAENAYERVQEFTWAKRSRAVLTFVERIDEAHGSTR